MNNQLPVKYDRIPRDADSVCDEKNCFFVRLSRKQTCAASNDRVLLSELTPIQNLGLQKKMHMSHDRKKTRSRIKKVLLRKVLKQLNQCSRATFLDVCLILFLLLLLSAFENVEKMAIPQQHSRDVRGFSEAPPHGPHSLEVAPSPSNFRLLEPVFAKRCPAFSCKTGGFSEKFRQKHADGHADGHADDHPDIQPIFLGVEGADEKVKREGNWQDLGMSSFISFQHARS